ncbi:unnamed protein product [Effrenium voratum]|nr:unnamed protein product [Effrenium voratum]
MVDTEAFINALCTTSREQAVSVISELLKNRPTLAPSVVNFACPDLTYAPARGLAENRAIGTLKSFSAKTGFGFIHCPELHEVFGADVFVHMKQLGHAQVLPAGTPVTFACVLGKENKPQAYDVQPMDGVLEAMGFVEPTNFEALGMAVCPPVAQPQPVPQPTYSGKRKWEAAEG